MDQLVPLYERSTRTRVAIQYASSAVLKRAIEAGEAFDLAILTPVAIRELTTAGWIAAGSATDIARSDLAVGVRAGAPKTDISTAESFKQRLLAARSITFSKEGAATAAFVEALARLGIADALKPRIVQQTVSRRQAESVAEGEHEIFFSPLSEIVSVEGVEVLGLFPREFQQPIVMTAGIATRAPSAAAARALVTHLLGPEAAPVLEATGMTPVRPEG
jgi:molybdate transport system substrate-binding protein